MAYEFTGFEGFPEDEQGSLQNYHHFLFISRKKKDEPISFTVEVVSLSFYSATLKLGDRHKLQFGKILVPFGADPLFHRSYGGLTGFDQKLFPVIWAEHGAAYKANVLRGVVSLDNELFVVGGFRAEEDQVLSLNGAGDLSRPAIGDRVRLGYGKFAIWLSFYWNQYAPGRNLFLWGLDASAAHGFLPWPILENLELKVGVVRADVRSRVLGNYYHFSDYLQVDYRLPADLRLSYRTGFVAFENHKAAFFDKDRKDAKDTVAHSLSLWWTGPMISVGLQYIFNLEAAEEIPNDLVRLTAVLEF